jgi:hypothetical protein
MAPLLHVGQVKSVLRISFIALSTPRDEEDHT